MPEDVSRLIFSLQRGKGLYMLLAGSGVSRSAGIPTGYDVMKELIVEFATANNEPIPTDPIAWFTERTGSAPTYSSILELMGGTPAERSQLIRHHFEPTRDDLVTGARRPSPAHRGIARLAASGCLRVILTTNFDSLIEDALQEAGLSPRVVSRPADFNNLPPLTHVPLCVIKLSGDYRDLYTLNTPSELEAYPDEVEKRVRKMLEDYGLIVCGWSAEYDRGLVSLLNSARSPHYTTFWTARAPLEGAAAQCLSLRGGTVVTISNADDFFETVAAGVEALDRSDASILTTESLLLSRLKRDIQQDDRNLSTTLRHSLREFTEQRPCIDPRT